MKAYYTDELITIYNADARELLPKLAVFDAIITDPVWPNAIAELEGSDDPYGLFTAVAKHFPRLAKRAVIHLGCDSDPRFLSAIPAEMPFFRTCWLEYVKPHYKGRVLYTSDVAYVFGSPPRSKPGQHLISGWVKARDVTTSRRSKHPCPRQLMHVKWLVKWFADGRILDPFCGSGTTLLAAKEAGLPAVGIEINADYCAMAAERLKQMQMFPVEVA